MGAVIIPVGNSWPMPEKLGVRDYQGVVSQFLKVFKADKFEFNSKLSGYVLFIGVTDIYIDVNNTIQRENGRRRPLEGLPSCGLAIAFVVSSR